MPTFRSRSFDPAAVHPMSLILSRLRGNAGVRPPAV
jgi:hypothetical protein